MQKCQNILIPYVDKKMSDKTASFSHCNSVQNTITASVQWGQSQSAWLRGTLTKYSPLWLSKPLKPITNAVLLIALQEINKIYLKFCAL